jgi:hypothetical protein
MEKNHGLYILTNYTRTIIEDNSVTKGLNDGVNIMVQQLRKAYRCPKKVIVIEEVRKIKTILKDIMKK